MRKIFDIRYSKKYKVILDSMGVWYKRGWWSAVSHYKFPVRLAPGEWVPRYLLGKAFGQP